MKKIIYVIIIFVFVFCCIEVFCRIINLEKKNKDERNHIYQYNDTLGWIGIPNLDCNISDIRIINNCLGFRDIEHNYTEKNKKRIMFIGDSFCWGYGVNQDKVFVELLRDKLKEYELFNCGISGYSTDQEFLLLQKYFNVIKPDIVFLLYCCINDNRENGTNFVFKNYYKPYYIIKDNNIELKGIPVPKTWLYYQNNFFVKNSRFIDFLLHKLIFLKNSTYTEYDITKTEYILLNIKKYLTEQNANFFIGFTSQNKILQQLCKSNKIKAIILESHDTIDNIHWNEKGHEYVADKIYNFFKQENIIK